MIFNNDETLNLTANQSFQSVSILLGSRCNWYFLGRGNFLLPRYYQASIFAIKQKELLVPLDRNQAFKFLVLCILKNLIERRKTMRNSHTHFRKYYLPVICFFFLISIGSTNTHATESFKIGVVAPSSGIHAAIGNRVISAIRVGADWVNATGGLLGRKVELVVEDDESNPTLGARKATKLILDDKVEYLIGSISSGVSIALIPIADKYNKICIVPVGAAAEITAEKCSRNVFRTAINFDVHAPVLIPWAVKNFGKKVYFFGTDYAMGWSAVKAGRNAIKEVGGEIVGEAYAPLGTVDFAPFMNKIKEAKPNVVNFIFAGTDAVRLLKQLDEFGVRKMAKVVGYVHPLEIDVLNALGPVGYGNYGSTQYVYSLDTPLNKKFRKDIKVYLKGEEPDLWCHAGWEAFWFLAQATQKVGSTDTKQIIEALENITIDTLTGKKSYFWKGNHQAVLDIYILETIPPEQGRYKIITIVPAEQVQAKMTNDCRKW